MRATYEGFQACFFGVFKRLRWCGDSRCDLCCNIAYILKGEEMTQHQNSSKWNDMELQVAKQMSDEGGGHKAYITKHRRGSMLLKCYQHCRSELSLYLLMLCVLFSNNVVWVGGQSSRTIRGPTNSSPGTSSSNGSIGICGTHL